MEDAQSARPFHKATGCRGFRNPWFRVVEKRGWYYVGRVRSPTHYQAPGAAWQAVSSLFQQVTSELSALGEGEVQIAHSNPLTTQMVLYHQSPKGRKDRNKRGNVYQDSASRSIARLQEEP